MRKLWEWIKSNLGDEDKRIIFQYICSYLVVGIVSLAMLVVNIFTGHYVLGGVMLAFLLLCVLNALMTRRSAGGMRIATGLFSVELCVIFVYFLVSGEPEGFSAIWICLLPSLGMLLFQRRRATILSMVMLAAMVFLLWTKQGASLLQYDYTDTFRMRFPILFLAAYIMSLYLETVHDLTHREMVRLKGEYQYLHAHDPLTNALNRRGFYELVEKLLAEGSDAPIGMLLLDVDHFKNINDTHGHAAGDAVLKELVHILEAELQTQVCRWGGEEFAIFLRTEQIAPKEMDRIRRRIESTLIRFGDLQLQITVSIGAVLARENQKPTLDALIRQADDCLYEAKDSGRNAVVFRRFADE